ncbi:Far upstream element-binding protein 3, partial [Nowakowskiella sp. JEL0078]
MDPAAAAIAKARAIAAKLGSKAAQENSDASLDSGRSKRTWDDEPEGSDIRGYKRSATDRQWDSRDDSSSRSRYGLGSSERSEDRSSHYGPSSGIDKRPAIIQVEEKYPSTVVGLIIGKGGETLKKIQQACNVKMQFNPDPPQSDGDKKPSDDRRATISGTPEDLEKARKMIAEIVDHSRPGSNRIIFPESSDPNKTTVLIEVPQNKVGLVIGKGGETIRSLEEQSGARIAVVTDPPSPDTPPNTRYVTVCGDDIAIATARRLVNDIVNQQPGYKVDTNFKPPPGSITEVVHVASDKVGLVIGK